MDGPGTFAAGDYGTGSQPSKHPAVQSSAHLSGQGWRALYIDRNAGFLPPSCSSQQYCFLPRFVDNRLHYRLTCSPSPIHHAGGDTQGETSCLTGWSTIYRLPHRLQTDCLHVQVGTMLHDLLNNSRKLCFYLHLKPTVVA
ncbi:uncharacterized protein LOC144604549 isoform X2 [Rhinoraja longicauda]